jgi:uncharacterized protein YsxB (DUF464 family)
LRLLGEEAFADIDGHTRRMTCGEAVECALIEEAMAGNVRAIKLVFEREAEARAEEARLRQIVGQAQSSELLVGLREALHVIERLRGVTLPPDIHEQVYGVPQPARDPEPEGAMPVPLADDTRAAGQATAYRSDHEPVCAAEDERDQTAGKEKAAEDERLAPPLGLAPGHLGTPIDPYHAAGSSNAPDTAGDRAKRKAEAEHPAKREPWDAHLSAPPPPLCFGNAPTGLLLPSVSSNPRRVVRSSEPVIKDTRPITRR